MIPIGNSVGKRRVLARKSVKTRKIPPVREENKKRYLWSGPIKMRIQWGTIKPTKPMIPLTETETAASRVERAKKIFLTRFTGQPKD